MKLPILIATLAFFATTQSNAGDGPTIFKESKCTQCHSVSSQGIKIDDGEGDSDAPDLSGEGLVHDVDWIKGWLTKTVKLHDKYHLKKFKGSDEDLNTLANWLTTLKTAK
jgi:hypothetical protein